MLLIMQMLSASVCIAVVMLGLAWRRKGISFPSQPGHWVAIYLAVALADGMVMAVTMLLLPSSGFMGVVRFSTHLVLHCFAALLWIAAYLREDSRIWRWGWGAMALRSVLIVSLLAFHVGMKGIEWLIEVFWYNSQVDLQLSWFLGSLTPFLMLKMWLRGYVLLVFLAAAMISDYRHARRRHWSHWLVLISTFVSTAALAFYYHWVL